ncbi:MAG: VIT family protein [Planctomycetes bacterium]|nr:VIT family protein [Planctomycetota bacterium]
MHHHEPHRSHRIGWLRAAVLGANDGIVSTASLLIGVAASGAMQPAILTAGVAGLVAGAMSMAAGEYVSVSSQRDTEDADRVCERRELELQPERELDELTGIYVERGLDRPLARQVAEALTAHDALGAHLRDELGFVEHQAARPVQAAGASAATFAVGAALPLAIVALVPREMAIVAAGVASLVSLAALGALGARAGGASQLAAAVRVVFWGALAMGVTFGIGALVGTSIA